MLNEISLNQIAQLSMEHFRQACVPSSFIVYSEQSEQRPITRKPPMFLMIMHGIHLMLYANQWVTYQQSHTGTQGYH